MPILKLISWKRLERMLNDTQIEKLKSNWGARAETLACYAEVRLFDPCSSWQCFIIAINPNDEDEINCIISTNLKASPEVILWTLSGVYSLFNSQGEGVEVDQSYRPIRAAELFKKLSELTIYEPNRH